LEYWTEMHATITHHSITPSLRIFVRQLEFFQALPYSC
jgi:hypothetical protein